MTKNECDSILRLRDSGSTYAQISEETGIPVNTLKTFFRRNSRKKKSEDEQLRCRECGGTIEQKPKTKRQIFCCGECRQKWWNSHPEAVHRKAVYNYTCPYCGRDFSAYGNAHRKPNRCHGFPAQLRSEVTPAQNPFPDAHFFIERRETIRARNETLAQSRL